MRIEFEPAIAAEEKKGAGEAENDASLACRPKWNGLRPPDDVAYQVSSPIRHRTFLVLGASVHAGTVAAALTGYQGGGETRPATGHETVYLAASCSSVAPIRRISRSRRLLD
jgi:hypothetical protein